MSAKNVAETVATPGRYGTRRIATASGYNVDFDLCSCGWYRFVAIRSGW